MNHYLVIAHHTATDPDLAHTLTRLVAADPYSAFTLLVTTTHHIYIEQNSDHEALARQRAEDGRRLLEAAHVYPVRVIVGAGSVVVAAQDELIANPDVYSAILLHTRAPRILGRLGGDLRRRIEARAGIPVFHAHRRTPEPWRADREAASSRMARLWRRTRFEEPTTLEERLDGPRPPNRRELLPIAALMLIYLGGGLTLALTVNRRFYLNDVVALIVYGLVVGGLLLAMRADRR